MSSTILTTLTPTSTTWTMVCLQFCFASVALSFFYGTLDTTVITLGDWYHYLSKDAPPAPYVLSFGMIISCLKIYSNPNQAGEFDFDQRSRSLQNGANWRRCTVGCGGSGARETVSRNDPTPMAECSSSTTAIASDLCPFLATSGSISRSTSTK